MRKAGFIVFCLVAVACTSTADIQRQCAALASGFVDEVSCIEAQIAQEPSLGDDSFVREYVLSGKVLAEKVSKGEITENEARLQFSRAYNDLLLSQQRYSAYNAIEFDRLRPRYTTCRESDGTIYCDTY